MSVIVAFAVGFLAARLVFVLLRPAFGAEVFRRQNYRGRDIPTACGLVIGIAVVLVEAARVTLDAAVRGDSVLDAARVGMLVLVAVLALLGVVDDVAGGRGSRGFRGHIAALRHGELTTGGLKLFGGAAAAALAVAIVRPSNNIVELLTDSALVALAANLANLFDLAPGRTTKVGLLCFVALAGLTTLDAGLGPVAVVIGASGGLLFDDLRERLMLGDAGANVVGGALGLAVVTVGSPLTRLAVLGVLAVLNGVSEWVSFSAVIDRVAPLRLLDRAGRRS